MTTKTWKTYVTETEPPQLFWPIYLVFVTVMSVFTYISYRFHSKTVWILLALLLITAIGIPLWYMTMRRKRHN